MFMLVLKLIEATLCSPSSVAVKLAWSQLTWAILMF